MRLPILPEQACLYELGPGDGRMAATRVDPDDRTVDAASVLAALQPVVQRALRYAEQPCCLRLSEHLPI